MRTEREKNKTKRNITVFYNVALQLSCVFLLNFILSFFFFLFKIKKKKRTIEAQEEKRVRQSGSSEIDCVGSGAML